MSGYDIIGDVHGCATQLEDLLVRLGYSIAPATNAYRHPERRAVFVGDLIDRGDEQVEVLRLVKAMVDSGSADIVMGNHEFNAVTWATKHPASGEYLRSHSEYNFEQHESFLTRVSEEDQKYYLEWFKTLPVWLDLGDIRVVHACWHEDSMRAVEAACGSNQLSTVRHFVDATTKGTDLHAAVEVLLKGPEIDLRPYQLPDYRLGGPKLRHEARIRWWDDDAATLRDLAELRGATTASGAPYPEVPELEIDPREGRTYIYTDRIPLFYGHYWRRWEPEHKEDWTTYTACVDFSAVGGGTLVAYQYNHGEKTVTPENYVPHDPRIVASTPSE